MPLLSVLLTTRNDEDVVARSVTSTLAALPSDAEVVALDTGSTDSTVSRLASIRDRRLRVHYAERPISRADALDRLLAITDSRFVALLDAQTRSIPGRFRAGFEAMRGHDVVFGGVLARQGMHTRRRYGVRLDAHELPFHLLLGDAVAESTLLARRRVVDYGRRDETGSGLVLRLAERGARMRVNPRPLVTVRGAQALEAPRTASAEAWVDPPSAVSAYEDLSLALLGRPFPPLTSLTPVFAGDRFGRRSDRFREAFLAATESLPPRSRRRLERTLEQRLTALAAPSLPTPQGATQGLPVAV